MPLDSSVVGGGPERAKQISSSGCVCGGAVGVGSASGVPSSVVGSVGGVAPGGKQLSAKKSLKLSSLADDMIGPPSATGSHQDESFRVRLHHLFAQIEREFELLHAENLSRKYDIPGIGQGW